MRLAYAAIQEPSHDETGRHRRSRLRQCFWLITKLRKVDGSVMLAIPPAVLDMLQLHAGAAVGLSVDDGHLVVDPQVRPRYTVDELLAQCDPSAALTVEDRVWIDGEQAGGELL